MLKNYLIFLPSVRGSTEEEWRQCLEQIKNTGLTGKKLVKLNVFTEITNSEDYLRVSKIIRESIINKFGKECPAFNVTVHPPEKPWKVTAEAGYTDTDNAEIESFSHDKLTYIVKTSGAGKELWAGGLGYGQSEADTRSAAIAAFDQMRAILDTEQMSFNHIVRQWNYIGNIIEVKNRLQNYQLFNEVRSENYQKFRTLSEYPAATGVGMKHEGVSLDFYAFKPSEPIKIFSVDNPDQIRPYAYDQQVLKGEPSGGKRKKQPPQFERAVMLSCDLGSTLFVSGTASILGQETIGIDDVEKQTSVTIENIKKLSDPEWLKSVTGISADRMTLILLRVYIKRQEDFLMVKTICQERFPGIPAVYIEADICRDNLLVEIEAEFSK